MSSTLSLLSHYAGVKQTTLLKCALIHSAVAVVRALFLLPLPPFFLLVVFGKANELNANSMHVSLKKNEFPFQNKYRIKVPCKISNKSASQAHFPQFIPLYFNNNATLVGTFDVCVCWALITLHSMRMNIARKKGVEREKVAT